MAAFPGDIGFHPGDFRAQLVDVVAQFLDPEGVQEQFFQARALARRWVVVIACHKFSFPRTGLSSILTRNGSWIISPSSPRCRSAPGLSPPGCVRWARRAESDMP
jgi:hypothetical protein